MNVTAIDKRHYWITGAGSGIGRSLTEQLAKAGHRCYVSGRSADKLVALANEIGGDIVPVPCDVSNDAQMKHVLEQHGIDVLDTVIICAGICEYIDMPDLDIDSIRRVTGTNFFGVVNTCIAALPCLRRQSQRRKNLKPHLIGVGSMSSYVGFPRAEAYAASKAAMAHFLHSLCTDLQEEVAVTVVYPGFVETPLTAKNDFPMPFMVSADKAASIILTKAESRPLTIAFPLRLHLLLRTMAFFSRLWYQVLAPKLSRSASS